MQSQRDSVQVSLKPKSIIFVLSGFGIFLIIASTVGQSITYLSNYDQLPLFARQLIRIFELGAEDNIPTHFSVVLILLSAMLLSFIFFTEKGKSDHPNVYWLILAGGFFFMAGDEAYQVHEKLINPVQNFLPGESFGFFYFAWVIPYSILVITLGIVFYNFLRRLPSKTRNSFLLAGILYLGGAIGVELIGGAYFELHGSDNFTYNMIQTVEESLEIAGLIVFIRALINKISNNHKEVILTFKK